MNTEDYYFPKDAQAIVGISASTLRNYVKDFERWLTTEATTPPRKFTADDLRLMAFIRFRTQEKQERLDAVQAALDAGAMDAFDWQPPPPPQRPTTATATQDSEAGVLVPLESLRLHQALLSESQRREEQASTEAAELRTRIEALQNELGRAQGELAAVKSSRYHAPRWWRALFGGRSAE